MNIAATQYLLGVRTTLDGLKLDPCIPADWKEYSVQRDYLGCRVKIAFENPQGVSKGVKSVTVDGDPVKLTPMEYNILRFLVINAGRVFSIEQIYENIWNEEAIGVENTVAVHIRHIREKIEIDPKNPRYLKVVWGLGYKVEKL